MRITYKSQKLDQQIGPPLARFIQDSVRKNAFMNQNKTLNYTEGLKSVNSLSRPF